MTLQNVVLNAKHLYLQLASSAGQVCVRDTQPVVGNLKNLTYAAYGVGHNIL